MVLKFILTNFGKFLNMSSGLKKKLKGRLLPAGLEKWIVG